MRFSDASNPEHKYVMTFNESKRYRALLKYYNVHKNLLSESNECIKARKLTVLHSILFADIIGIESDETIEIPIKHIQCENIFF